MDWSKLGKKRSRFGQWLDSRQITTNEMSNMSGVSRDTIGQLANDDERSPSWRTEKKIVDVAQNYDDDVSSDDWGW